MSGVGVAAALATRAAPRPTDRLSDRLRLAPPASRDRAGGSGVKEEDDEAPLVEAAAYDEEPRA